MDINNIIAANLFNVNGMVAVVTGDERICEFSPYTPTASPPSTLSSPWPSA
jgi:hypothetical protein